MILFLLQGNLKYPIISCGIVTVIVYILSGGQVYVFDLVGGICQQGTHIPQVWGEIYFHAQVSLLYCAIPSTMLFLFNIVIMVQMRSAVANLSLFLRGRGGGGGLRVFMEEAHVPPWQKQHAFTLFLKIIFFG